MAISLADFGKVPIILGRLFLNQVIKSQPTRFAALVGSLLPASPNIAVAIVITGQLDDAAQHDTRPRHFLLKNML